MNRQSSRFGTNSAQYLDFLRYTSTSAVQMATSTAVPAATGWSVRVEPVDVPSSVEEREVPGAPEPARSNSS